MGGVGKGFGDGDELSEWEKQQERKRKKRTHVQTTEGNLIKIDQSYFLDTTPNQHGSGGASDPSQADDDDESITNLVHALITKEDVIASQRFSDDDF